MNFATGSFVCISYPRAFLDKEGFINPSHLHLYNIPQLARKYRQRGYTTFYALDGNSAFRRDIYRLRSFGDGLSKIIQLTVDLHDHNLIDDGEGGGYIDVMWDWSLWNGNSSDTIGY